jgi:hypothetical protein
MTISLNEALVTKCLLNRDQVNGGIFETVLRMVNNEI